jgi:hypothetical protein
MPSINPPSNIPVCTNQQEIRDEKRNAEEGQRPFLAVTDEEAMPGWRARYMMDQTGENREAWYFLTDSAVDEVDKRREQYVQYIQQDDVIIEGCGVKEGALHGLDKPDAKDLAGRFVDIVWDTDNWERYAPREVFEM